MAKTYDLSRVSVIAELDRLQWDTEPAGDNELRLRCPNKEHTDSKPSASINIDTGAWYCHGCKAKGDIASFISLALGQERNLVLAFLVKEYGLDPKDAPMNPEIVERYHEALKKEVAAPMLKELRKRGINDEMLEQARLGFDSRQNRITIPVYNDGWDVVNVRRYLPGAPGDKKFRNSAGRGRARIYQPKSLADHDTVWLCGGELKALVAAYYLREFNVGAFAISAGEGAWNHEWNELIRGKIIYVCMDADDAGRRAALRISQFIYDAADKVFIVDLPLDPDKFPKGDVNDWVAAGAREDQFKAVMASAKPYSPPQMRDTVVVPCEPVKLAEVEDYPNRRVSFEAIVYAIADDVKQGVPKDVLVLCDRNQPMCHQCPAKLKPLYNEEVGAMAAVEMTIPPYSKGVLAHRGANAKQSRNIVREALRIPECKSFGYEMKTGYVFRDIRLTPKITFGDIDTKEITVPAYTCVKDLESNTTYEFEGVVYHNPKDSETTVVITAAKQIEDSLDTYEVTETEREQMKVFQPESWTVDGIRAKLDSIYEDFAGNVTNIYGRQNLHLATDIAYHSPLLLPYRRGVVKGWVNGLILGDTAQGKSAVTMKLLEHYGLGTRVDCKNATQAGLLGGLQQIGNQWFVTWGMIPRYDRQIVILEEVKESQRIIGTMTDMRSRGIIEIQKIIQRRAHARTRLVFISNPVNSRNMASYAHGVEAISELIGSPEDIRRFDYAVIVSKDDKISREEPEVEHQYTSELCRSLILWGWTRHPEQIVYDEGTQEAAARVSKKLQEKYCEHIPLVDSGTTEHKVLRIASALAIRLYSTRNGEDLLVRRCHVEYTGQMLDEWYAAKTFGYDEYTRIYNSWAKLTHEDQLRELILESRFPADFVQALLTTDLIQRDDFVDWLGVERDATIEYLSLMVRSNALRRVKAGTYQKNPPFIQFLKRLEGIATTDTGDVL